MHGIEVFQLGVNDLLKVGFGVCSVHKNCFITIINFYKNTFNYCFIKFYFDKNERILHETIISSKNEKCLTLYICIKQQFSCR